MKAILVIDMPTECIECEFCRVFADGKPTETHCTLTAQRNEDGVNTISKWCPLRHPLKEVNNDFYIYDRKYLFDNLEREIDLLKKAKRFEEHMKEE